MSIPLPDAPTAPDRPLRADAARNRARVLDAAEAVFTDLGQGATIEAVARRAGVGVGTVCRRFPTKQALLDAVVTRMTESLLDDALDAREVSDPGAAFELFVHRLADQQARHRLLAEQMASSFELPSVADDVRTALRTAISDLVEGAQAAGALRADISAADVAVLFAGIAQATAITSDVVPALRDRYVEVVLDGLRPAAASELPGRPLGFDDLERLRLARAARPSGEGPAGSR